MLCEDSLHRCSHNVFKYFPFRFWDIKHKFIVDLEYHRTMESAIANICTYINHREFYHICCGSLNRHIHRLSFSNRANCLVGIIDGVNISPPTKIRLNIAFFSCLSENSIIIFPNFRILCIECFDISICFVRTTIKSLRESESSNPIDNPEVYCFCNTSLLWSWFPSVRLCE